MKSLALAMLLVSSVAVADPVDPGVMEDANAGHDWLMPTALVPAEGTWSIDGQELVGIGMSYAISDRVIASVTTVLLPINSGLATIFSGSLKVQLVHTDELRIAAIGAAIVDHYDFPEDSESGTDAAVYGAAVATVCLDHDCGNHLDTSAAILHASGQGQDDYVELGVALVAGPPHLKAVLELDDLDAFGKGRAGLAIIGARITSRHGALDFGWGTCVRSANCGNGPGVPLVQYAARF